MDTQNKIKLIYISGIGRSGSTLMDMIISSSDKVFSVGEVFRYNLMWQRNPMCSCGNNMHGCEVWRNVAAMQDFQIANRYNFNDYLKLLNFLYNPFAGKPKFSKSDNYELLQTVKSQVGDYEYILDSSKDPVRLLELAQDNRFEVINITVVRDVRGTATSFSGKGHGQNKSYLMTVFKWLFINVITQRLTKKLGIKTMTVGYDSFSQNPQPHLDRIGDFLGFEVPADYITRVQKMDDYHNVGGNRLVRKEGRAEFSGVSYRQNWDKSPAIHNSFAKLVAGWLNKKLVYRKTS